MKHQKKILATIGILIILGFTNKFVGPNKFARFEVQIEKVDNEIVKGYIVTEEMIDKYDNPKFQNWILSNNGDYTRGNKIWLCTKQYFFNHPEPKLNYFSCCRESIEISKDEILKIDKLKTVKDVNQSIGKQISDKEQNLLETEPSSKYSFYIEGEVIHDSGGDYFVDYWLLSYNQKIGEKELKEIRNQIANEYLKSKEGAKWNGVYDNWAKIYSKYREELINRNVIFLEIGGM